MWVLVGGGVQQVLHSSWGWRPACAGAARMSVGDGVEARAHAIVSVMLSLTSMSQLDARCRRHALDEMVQLRVAKLV
jgi:hypothetical protein